MIERWIVDTEPSVRFPIYTRANVGEVFPEPVAPLSATLGIRDNAEPGWRDALVRFGCLDYDELEEGPTLLGIFGGYCYLNVSVARVMAVRTPGLSPEMVDQSFFGEQPGVTAYAPRPGDESPRHTGRVSETIEWILTTADLVELREDQEAVNRLRAERPDLSTLTEVELLARVRRLMAEHFRRLYSRHIFVTYAATVPMGIIQAVCEAIGEPDLVLKLVAGVGDVESAVPSMQMWRIARMAQRSPSLTRAFDGGVAGLDGRLLDLASGGDGDASQLLAELDRFLFAHGSRGPNEWEVRSPTWETMPELALAAIDLMRLAPEAHDPQAHQAAMAAEREQIGAAITSALAVDPETQVRFQAALGASKLFMAGRERSKTNAIKLVHEVRMTARELGARMVRAGHLEHWRVLSMLVAEELDGFLADPSGISGELARREGEYGSLAALEPPFVFEGSPPPRSAWLPRGGREVPLLSSGAAITGLAGCPGRAVGRARVLLDPFDPAALRPGDVLVAPLTDPSWTPLFVPAAAVVVDVGAALSHAVIVSRELGIPCVVSATDATRRIADGALVEVDGTAGIVTVLELP